MDDAGVHHRLNAEPLDGDVIARLQALVESLSRPTVLPSRGMLRKEAANYCGMTPRSFSARVKAGKLPQPAMGKGRGAIWDRHEIDAAWDRGIDNRTAQAAADTAEDLIRRTQDYFKRHDK